MLEPTFHRIDERRIDSSDETFRIRARHPESLAASIRRGGIRAPLIVEEAGEKLRIVSGWGRWLARPPASLLPCFVLPGGLGREEVWDMFLRDNDRWNVVEVGRVLRALEGVAGLDPERIVTDKLPLLGVRASRELHRRLRRLPDLGPVARQFIEEEDLPLRRTEVFFKLPAVATDLLVESARELRLTLNEVGETLEQVDEIADRDRVPPEAVILDARRAAGGAGKEAFRTALRTRRHPELSRYQARLEECLGRLRFTVPVRVEWDPQLERPGVRLVADLANPDALQTFEDEIRSQRALLDGFFEVV